MKLRFGVDPAAVEQIRGRLDAICAEPPVGRLLSYVYLDTPDGDLAGIGAALRFRRSAALGASPAGRPWKRQVIHPKDATTPSKALGIGRLARRLDATFSLRIERWTWQPGGWARVSLDAGELTAAGASQTFNELRIVCKKKCGDRAMHFAVELGAMHLSSTRARERGLALVAATRP